MIHSHKQVNSPGSIWCVWVPPAVLGPVMPRSMCKFRCAAVREVVYHRYSAFPLPFLHPPFLRAPGSSSRESVCEQPGGAEPRQAGWGWLWVLPGVTLSVSPASRRCPHRSPSAAPLLIPPLLLPPPPPPQSHCFSMSCAIGSLLTHLRRSTMLADLYLSVTGCAGWWRPHPCCRRTGSCRPVSATPPAFPVFSSPHSGSIFIFIPLLGSMSS